MRRRLMFMLFAAVGLLASCKKPSAGAEPHVIITGTGWGPSFDADDEELFWTELADKDGRVNLRARRVDGGDARTLTTGHLDHVVVRGMFVYFDESDDVMRMPRGGGVKEKLASEDARIAGLAVDGDEVFYVAGTKVRAVKPGAPARDVAADAKAAKDAHGIVVTPTDVVWVTAPLFASSDPEHGALWAAPRAGGNARKIHRFDVPGEIVARDSEIFFRDGAMLHHATMPEGLPELLGGSADRIVGVDADGVWMARAPGRFKDTRGELRHVSKKGAVTHRTSTVDTSVAYSAVRTTSRGAFASDGIHIVDLR